MKNPDRGSNPRRLKPVTKIELSGKHFTLRLVLAVLALLVALGALGYALVGVLNTDPGWKQVEASTDQLNCSADFVLNYYLGDAGISATEEYRALSLLYTQATENGYRIFTKDEQFESVHNVCYVNAHVNEDITVDPALYDAFAKIQAAGNRCVYLAPVYVEYNRMFLCENAQEAARYDPGQNSEIMAYVTELAAFANDPEMIDIVLLGDNRIRLQVSQEYLSYAQENGIEEFLDFSWMKNAFLADYIAAMLAQEGFTRGYLASYDGFTRNLDDSGSVYTLNVFDRLEDVIYMPARMDYAGAMSIVSLRNYPMSESDRWHYYSFTGSRIATVFLDPADGVSKSATDNLLSYSRTGGCAEILLRIAPLYLADSLDTDGLNALTGEGIFSLWGEEQVLRYNDQALTLELVQDTEVPYTKAFSE